MDRNIITRKDAQETNAEVRAADDLRRKTEGLPERKAIQGPNGLPGTIKPDETLARLVKFIPAEALSLYLALSGITATVQPPADQALYWLTALLSVTALFNALYLYRLWNVTRITQIAASTVALIIYAIAANGPLVQALKVPPIAATLALTVVTAFLCFFEPPEDLRGKKIQSRAERNWSVNR